ncbi:uncharacterized protein [Montipora capricornis]|uniref:uncharacterized protein isoform X3 n=1 Tax=Montipora capricornis TaxID=246305 RepID=UPI0035F1EAB1
MDFKIIWSLSLFLNFGLPTEPSEPVVYVRRGQNITLPCPTFSEALEVGEGRFRYIRWYLWTDNCFTKQLELFAWMNEGGQMEVGRILYKGFSISRDDGSLFIRKVQPCHAQNFMCSIVLWNGANPLPGNVTLKFVDENENYPTGKAEPTEVRTTSESKNVEKENCPRGKPEPTEVRTTSESKNLEKGEKITDQYLVPFIVVTIIAVPSVIGNVLAILHCRRHRQVK